MVRKSTNNIKKNNFVYGNEIYSILTNNYNKLGKNGSQKAVLGA